MNDSTTARNSTNGTGRDERGHIWERSQKAMHTVPPSVVLPAVRIMNQVCVDQLRNVMTMPEDEFVRPQAETEAAYAAANGFGSGNGSGPSTNGSKRHGGRSRPNSSADRNKPGIGSPPSPNGQIPPMNGIGEILRTAAFERAAPDARCGQESGKVA